MNILAFTPQSRVIPRALSSILALEWDGRLTHTFLRGGDVSDKQYETCFQKCVQARRMALDGGYDALFLVDDDIIVLPGTLKRLAAVGADITYALYSLRPEPHQWNAAHTISETSLELYGARTGDMQRAWGKAIPVAGIGTACTLITRPVLETLPLQRRGTFAHDWYLAVDAQQRGFRQVCICEPLAGHVDGESVYWPTQDGYRVDHA